LLFALSATTSFSLPSNKRNGDSCNLFQMTEIEPAYIGGNKMLSSDFARSLSKKERKQVKASSNFVVHFYLTKTRQYKRPFFYTTRFTARNKGGYN
jgi:hypothetical protein